MCSYIYSYKTTRYMCQIKGYPAFCISYLKCRTDILCFSFVFLH